MDPVSMVSLKRSSPRPHTDEELEWWIREYTNGRIPEYQMSAWLMAVCWRGLDDRETATLTRCMVESGVKLEWPKDSNVVYADKHSTGGVGDKISLVLAPLAACMGVKVPMMAGRGLGHTGGTIDKLESIPGYRTSLEVERFQSLVDGVGCSIVSPNQSLCPADRKLYALRDVTATVSCIPLQTASIMSKKIAENPQYLVLDVKYGVAAFQDSPEAALVLAHAMVATGEGNHVHTTAFLTRMDHPIGQAAGNWLEVYECLQILKTGEGARDLITLVVVQAAEMARAKHPELSWDELVKKTLWALQSGQAYSKFKEMVKAQGGDTTVLDECPPNKARFKRDILAPQDGTVANINALVVGKACVKLGAGRTNAEDSVDFNAGIWFHQKVGDEVQEGHTVVATVYTNSSPEALEQAIKMVEHGIEYSGETVQEALPPVISHRVTKGGNVEPFEIPLVLQKLP